MKMAFRILMLANLATGGSHLLAEETVKSSSLFIPPSAVTDTSISERLPSAAKAWIASLPNEDSPEGIRCRPEQAQAWFIPKSQTPWIICVTCIAPVINVDYPLFGFVSTKGAITSVSMNNSKEYLSYWQVANPPVLQGISMSRDGHINLHFFTDFYEDSGGVATIGEWDGKIIKEVSREEKE